MQRRIKKLLAIILSCVIFIQMFPAQARAAMMISGETILLTQADATEDSYEIEYGGTLQFDKGITVDGSVYFGSGSDLYLMIPSGSTLNGSIYGFKSGVTVQNSGSINSLVGLSDGVIENKGYISEVVVSSGGMLKAYDGASFGALNTTSAGSGQVITEGDLTVGTLTVSPYGFSTLDSSVTNFNVTNSVAFTGTYGDIDDKFRIVVDDTTPIKTNGQSGLYVWKDGVKYPLPEYPLNGETIKDFYSVSIDKTKLSFDPLTVGYQTKETSVFKVTNSGMAYIDVAFTSDGEWDTMFTTTLDSETIINSAKVSLAPEDAAEITVTMNKGMTPKTHSGTLAVACSFPDGDVFETFHVTSDIVVEKKPSIPAPSGEFYSFSGTAGDNGFYTSDVKVTPADGYLIAKSLDDDFAGTVTYTKSIAAPVVYLQKDSTGQITEKATLSEIKIDKDKPEIKNVSSGKTYYKKAMAVTVTDDNLKSVTLNGMTIDIADGKATVNLVRSDSKDKYVLKAKDAAGNTKVITFYLAPEWMEEGTVPSGQAVKLSKGTPYSFGNGTWTVSGDTTTYAGGVTFYVANDGQYTFQSN